MMIVIVMMILTMKEISLNECTCRGSFPTKSLDWKSFKHCLPPFISSHSLLKETRRDSRANIRLMERKYFSRLEALIDSLLEVFEEPTRLWVLLPVSSS
jgi:hypothetical protein